MPRGCVFATLLCLPSVAGAVDAVTRASRDALPAGTVDAAIWLTGRGFAEGATVSISGDGVTENAAPDVVPEAERIDGGRGDGITYRFALAANATPGTRNITVANPDGASATLENGFTVLPAEPGVVDPPPMGAPDAGMGIPPDPGNVDPPNPGGMNPPAPGVDGRVDLVSRASPNFGEQGAQLNIWVVGRSFTAQSQVSFSVPGLVPALYLGAPLPIEVVPLAESEQGAADGIIYFLRIPPDAPVGQVDITVTNADGSSATGAGIFRVVAPGQVAPPVPGDGDVDGISGASPRAVRSGRHVSLWVWGKGFDTGASLTFATPGINAYANPEVVKVSQSHPGFSGLRNFLVVDASTPPGPVRLTVTNPNGTSAVADDILTVVGAAGGGGGFAPGQDAVGDGGPCPDEVTFIESVDRVVPDEIEQGESVNLAITGRSFACGASVVIPGGGIKALDSPRLVRTDPADPASTTLFWQIELTEDAKATPRDVTVVNPNNSSKTLVGAFEVVEVASAKKEGFRCTTVPGDPSSQWPWFAWLGAVVLRRRGRHR